MFSAPQSFPSRERHRHSAASGTWFVYHSRSKVESLQPEQRLEDDDDDGNGNYYFCYFHLIGRHCRAYNNTPHSEQWSTRYGGIALDGLAAGHGLKTVHILLLINFAIILMAHFLLSAPAPMVFILFT